MIFGEGFDPHGLTLTLNIVKKNYKMSANVTRSMTVSSFYNTMSTFGISVMEH